MGINPVALQILGTGEYVPGKRIDSSVFDRHWNKPAGWTFENTGVQSRAHVSPGETCITMGALAARAALERASLQAAELDAVISISSVGHQAIPCTAVLIHRELGMSDTGIPAFDINSTCVGFLTALNLMSSAIDSGRMRHVLIVASEVASLGLNWDDQATAGLFGDGAGAIVLGVSRSPGAQLRGTLMRTFSGGADLCELRACGTGLSPRGPQEEFLSGTYFEMNGRSIYRMAATLLPGFLPDLLRAADTSMDEIDVWVPHQASGKALEHIQAALDLPEERMVRTLATHGNQVAASLPIAVHRGIESGKITAGKRVALLGTGAGITLAGAVLQF